MSNVPKYVESFRKHKLLPNGKQYFIAMVRQLRGTKFRIAIMNENECWISMELLFEKVRNPACTNANFRSDLIMAFAHPNHEQFEINETNCDKKGNPMSVSTAAVIPIKLLKVCQKASGVTIVIANIKCYKSKRTGSNLLYILEKMDKTLLDHKKKNCQLLEDNKKFQERYNQSLVLVDEATLAKNNQEQELMGKFVLILNEKKKKIQALEAEILRLKQGGKGDDNKNKKRKRDDDDDTFEDQPNKKRKLNDNK